MTDLSAAVLALAGLSWLGLLFAVAVYGERRPDRFQRLWPVVYSLSLAVYCTAWTFYGTTTQAVRSGWPLMPTFIGTILMFVFGWPFLMRLVQLSKQLNSTSLADFIASRFGKSSLLAAVVTAVAVLGIVPYISLQLKAVAMSFGALGAASGEAPGSWQGLAFWVALSMAVFAVLFGTRHAQATKLNRGLVLAMSFESLFKLTAMLALGVFVLMVLYPGPVAWNAATPQLEFSSPLTFLTLTVLGALAMFTLPHQFHIGVVECRDPAHLRTARWLFPLFLILIGLPILPLARAGEHLLGGAVPSDLYVLMLPLEQGNHGLALFAFLGGLSAATGMVILASLALSIMISNHWLTPLLVNRRSSVLAAPGLGVRLQRRLGIALVVLLAWIWSRLAETGGALADIGALSFSGLAQLAPAVVLAVYRPGLPARAVLVGLLGGVAVWAYVLLVPLVFASSEWLANGPFGLTWLAPDGLFGLGAIEALPRAVISSMVANGALIALVCRSADVIPGPSKPTGHLGDDQLRELAGRFLPESRVHVLFAGRPDPDELEAGLEHELAAVVGAASARLLLDAARRRAPVHFDAVADMVGQASEQARFSREVLSGALENMSQGICVIDAQLKLVAWNQAYLDLFDYPAALIRVGRPVADLLRHNAQQGLMSDQDVEAAVQRRLAHKRAGTRHLVERRWPDGRIIEIRGNPMPGGEFVATFSDVTAFRNTEAELKQINETLEQRVAARTSELQQATRLAEQASQAKSRFLAAVSHDLVQPLNAARLMTHSLSRQLNADEARRTTAQISGALGATEDLLESLLDISRLDAGGLEPRISDFTLDDLFSQLAGEFKVLAENQGLEFRCQSASVAVRSDPHLLRRILQNFLSNAVRYTTQGRILLAARRQGDRVRIGVWDTGPGIPDASRALIFEEFRRLDESGGAPGLGLGLAIAERMARLLDHRLLLDSREGRGTCFSVEVPRVSEMQPVDHESVVTETAPQARVLLVDNDARMRVSLSGLLEGWGFDVNCCADGETALGHVDSEPDLLMIDYHLDDEDTGLAVLARLRSAGCRSPALLVSADHAAELRMAAREAGCDVLHKPIRPLALRSMLRRLLGA